MDPKKAHNFRGALVALALFPLSVKALEFPDTAQVKKDWRLLSRVEGRPAVFFRKADGDSQSLVFEWASGRLSAARYEQDQEFEQDAFNKLTEAYGNGAAWHEFAGAADAAAKKLYPGLQQQWLLKGYGSGQGWLGSGVLKSRYFLVFRAIPPVSTPAVAGPLRLNKGWPAFLDTSSEWLHIPCPKDSASEAFARQQNGRSTAKGKTASPDAKGAAKASAAKAPACFSPGDNARLIVRILKRSPLSVDVSLEEEESESLQQIRQAVQTVSDATQHEYAQDLAQLLQGEAQMFLVKFAQRAPGLFNWPSWQLQDLKEGRVPESRFLEIIRSESAPGESLPALRYEDRGLRMSLDLYYRGAYRMQAQEL
jgi:hypothetical protein